MVTEQERDKFVEPNRGVEEQSAKPRGFELLDVRV